MIDKIVTELPDLACTVGKAMIAAALIATVLEKDFWLGGVILLIITGFGIWRAGVVSDTPDKEE